MLTHRYLVLLSLLVVAITTLASASNDELKCATSTFASQDELLDTMVNGHRRLIVDPDLRGQNTDRAREAPPGDSENETIESAAGHNRRDKGDDSEKKGGKKGCSQNQPATPTYHINVGCEDKKYQTISLPAQGCPFVYGDDLRSSLPPLLKPGCCQRYCYNPCCQPTCGAYGACPPQRVCYDPCNPYCHHLEPCCQNPPPHCNAPPCCCPPPCPPPCVYPPQCCPPPWNCGGCGNGCNGCDGCCNGCGGGCNGCNGECPPPPFVYDASCDHTCKNKKKKKSHDAKSHKKNNGDNADDSNNYNE